MTTEELPGFVRDIINSIANDNDFVDFSMLVKSGSQAGDGFTSELLSIAITDNKSDKRLDLVCKVAPANKNYRKEFFSQVFFSREALFYDKLMPIFSQFQEEKNIPKDDQFVSYPKCYATKIDEVSEQFVIVLEDLRPQGFKLWNKAIPSPIENARLAMKELGKFHGLSMALKDQKPEVFAQFKQFKDLLKPCIQSNGMAQLFNSSFDRAIDSLKSENHKNIMTHIKGNINAYLEDCLGEDAADRFGVLCHGDFWNNNMLFKFNEQGVAEEVRILDFQIIRYSSPATDILYNLFTSTEKSLRDNEYDNLIALYHKSLSKTLTLLGSNPDKLFTADNLCNELRMCGNHVLIKAPMLVSISQANTSQISNMDEILDNDVENKTLDLISGLSDKGQTEYVRRLSEVFDDIIRLGYYRKID